MELIQGDCRDVMARMIERGRTFHSVVTDPPYHLTSVVKRFGGENAAPAQHGTDGAFARASKGFMGKSWDGGDIAHDPRFWRLCHDLLLPGGYLVAFSSTRTGHRMACAIEDAGFVIHPMWIWAFGTGMPKATNPAKALEARGADPAAWEGWRHGTQAQKPAFEPIYVAQRPISEPTMADNLLKHGVGCVNIDGCRVPIDPSVDDPRLGGRGSWRTDKAAKNVYRGGYAGDQVSSSALGRWPANLVHDGSAPILDLFPHTKSGTGAVKKATAAGYAGNAYGTTLRPVGTPNVEYGDEGSAARFFYCAKASRAEREGTSHPTTKPLDLMRYLCRHVTPPGGRILDPFAGSGTTGRAAIDEGFDPTLIEMESEYVRYIETRIPELYDEFV